MVKQPDLDLYVTWAALENALKGLKEAIDSKQTTPALTQPQSQPQTAQPTVQTHQAYTQTTSPLPPKVIKKSTPPSTPQNPTKELEELLNKLGTLNERHERLKEEVDKLRDELAKKPTTGAFKLPDDFAQRLDEIKLIKAALEELKNNLNSESSKRLQLESVIANINHEIDNMKNVLKELLKSAELNRDDIAVRTIVFLAI